MIGPVGARVVVRALAPDPARAIEGITIEPQPPPDPGTLGPRDAVVAVRAAAVGWVDLIMMAGQYQHVPPVPYTPGLEYAGVVAWVGADAAASVRVGDEVLVDPFIAGPRSRGAYQAWGGFASYAVAPAEAILPRPAALSFDEACNLLGNYETAYYALVTRGRVAPGETVLIHGASGATGLAAVHLAKRIGARVIATGRDPARLAIVRAQGADEVVVSTAGPGARLLRDDVKALTGGRGADVVYDPVGGDLAAESLRCLRFGGRYLVVGWASTPGVATPLATNLVMMKGLDVLGCPTVISSTQDPSLRPPRLAALLAWAGAGEIRPHVSRVDPLERIQDALRAKLRGEIVGGAVVHP